MKLNPYATVIAMAILFLTACKKNSSPSVKTTTNTKVDVYISGESIDNINGRNIVTYWKNGVPTYLGPGIAYGIAVSNGNVYIAGYYRASNGNDVATYWKNGKPVYLADSTSYSQLTSIFVQGDDVYVAGETGKSPNESDYIETYWKNGVPESYSTAGSMASSIVVNGGDIYTAGYTNNISASSARIPTYWKNGIATNLPNSHPNGAEVSCIAIDGSNMYFGGTSLTDYQVNANTKDYYQVASYWKNGTPTLLEDTATHSYVLSAAIQNHTALFVGYSANSDLATSFVAEYWKNNTKTLLADTQSNSEAESITINGDDVYIAGFYKTDAAYWKNGVINTLTGLTGGSNATGIVVVPQN